MKENEGRFYCFLLEDFTDIKYIHVKYTEYTYVHKQIPSFKKRKRSYIQ